MLFLKSVMHYPNQNMGVRNAILQDSTNLKYAMSEILRDGSRRKHAIRQVD